MSAASILRAHGILVEEINRLPVGKELRTADLALMLARENVCLSAASMTGLIKDLVSSNLLVRVTTKRLAVAARLKPVVAQDALPTDVRIANLESLLSAFSKRLAAVESRLI